MYNTIFYFYNISEIGGIETFFYEIAQKYYLYDITIIYRIGNEKQINRLKEFIRVKQFDGSTIKCKQAFFNFNIDIIDSVQADEYIGIIHGDYKDMMERKQILSLPIHPKITRHIGVSQLVCDHFTEITGLPCELCYNPFIYNDYKKPIMLISATRLSVEKGFERIKKFAQELDKQQINYLWFIFTNSPQEYISPNVIYLPTRLDIDKLYKGFDFLVQLSDNEGFCYSIIEALSAGIPIITTPLPVLKELNVNENNSIIINFDCSNLQQAIELLTKKFLVANYKAPKDRWDEILINSSSDYYKIKHTKAEVSATDLYIKQKVNDAELNRQPNENEKWITSLERGRMLESKNYVKILEEIYEEETNNNNSIL